MSIAKKEFIALANKVIALESHYRRYAKEEPKRVITTETVLGGYRAALAAFCFDQNPRFNQARWLGYIAGTNGPSGGEVKQSKQKKV